MPFEVIFQIILPFHQKGWPPLYYTIRRKPSWLYNSMRNFLKIFLEKNKNVIWLRKIDGFIGSSNLFKWKKETDIANQLNYTKLRY
jgi:hypothetical protein